MGYDLKLLVPAADRVPATIRGYHSHLEAKLADLSYGAEAARSYRWDSAIEDLTEEGTFLLYERIPRDAADVLDDDRFTQLCADEEIWSGCRLTGSELVEFIDLLREAKRQLQRERPDEANWELTFESQSIALCEYALENGYAVELTPS